MSGRPPQDPPKHITATLVARQNAVADEKGDRTAVVGNHADRDVVLFIFFVGPAADLFDEADDARKEVGFIVALHPLDDGRQALQTHPRVDVRPGQRRHLPGGVAVELGEDQVPDLEMPVAFAVDVAGRFPAARTLPLVVDDLGAGAAGAGLPHHPEIALLAHPDNPLRRDPHLFIPDPERLVVVPIDRDPQSLLRQGHHARQVFPRPGDRLDLEIIPE